MSNRILFDDESACKKSLLTNLTTLRNQSSSEDCSIDTELSAEFSQKNCVRDANSTNSESEEIYVSKTIKQSPFAPSNFIQNAINKLTGSREPSPSTSLRNRRPSPIRAKNDRMVSPMRANLKHERLKSPLRVSPAPLPPPRAQYRFADECEYRMNHKHRGIAVIINNKKFHASLEMPTRSGTDQDAASIEKTFTKLGFTVRLEHNKSATDMRDILGAIAKIDYSDADCLVCCLLSHGEEGLIYGTDGSVEIEHLIAPFKFNRTLVGKPKLFFIQACRGTKLMDGIDTNPYTIQYVNKIPIEADFLIAYSTVAGYYSWRNSLNGSWFIQSLCEMLNLHGNSMELLHVLTAVNRKVAYHYESNADQASMSGKRQIPCVLSMLTKELYFKPKMQYVADV